MLGDLQGVGEITICQIDDNYPRQLIPSLYENWGEMAAANQMLIDRWCVKLAAHGKPAIDVGYLSAHAVWYGPTVASKAMNIGVSIIAEYRSQGIGTMSQRLLAEHLHEQGYLRVEASTDVENKPEQHALAGAGFQFEGIARLAQGRADGIHDLQVWSHIANP